MESFTVAGKSQIFIIKSIANKCKKICKKCKKVRLFCFHHLLIFYSLNLILFDCLTRKGRRQSDLYVQTAEGKQCPQKKSAKPGRDNGVVPIFLSLFLQKFNIKVREYTKYFSRFPGIKKARIGNGKWKLTGRDPDREVPIPVSSRHLQKSRETGPGPDPVPISSSAL